jgi:hypothetical protein
MEWQFKYYIDNDPNTKAAKIFLSVITVNFCLNAGLYVYNCVHELAYLQQL